LPAPAGPVPGFPRVDAPVAGPALRPVVVLPLPAAAEVALPVGVPGRVLGLPEPVPVPGLPVVPSAPVLVVGGRDVPGPAPVTLATGGGPGGLGAPGRCGPGGVADLASVPGRAGALADALERGSCGSGGGIGRVAAGSGACPGSSGIGLTAGMACVAASSPAAGAGGVPAVPGAGAPRNGAGGGVMSGVHSAVGVSGSSARPEGLLAGVAAGCPAAAPPGAWNQTEGSSPPAWPVPGSGVGVLAGGAAARGGGAAPRSGPAAAAPSGAAAGEGGAGSARSEAAGPEVAGGPAAVGGAAAGGGAASAGGAAAGEGGGPPMPGARGALRMVGLSSIAGMGAVASPRRSSSDLAGARSPGAPGPGPVRGRHDASSGSGRGAAGRGAGAAREGSSGGSDSSNWSSSHASPSGTYSTRSRPPRRFGSRGGFLSGGTMRFLVCSYGARMGAGIPVAVKLLGNVTVRSGSSPTRPGATRAASRPRLWAGPCGESPAVPGDRASRVE
jgi:hypothetical protein